MLEIPESLTINTGDESPSRPRAISEMIDAVATPATPNVSICIGISICGILHTCLVFYCMLLTDLYYHPRNEAGFVRKINLLSFFL